MYTNSTSSHITLTRSWYSRWMRLAMVALVLAASPLSAEVLAAPLERVCPPARSSPISLPPAVSSTEVHGTLLASVVLDAGHTVEFYEFAPGLVGVREVRQADAQPPVLNQARTRNQPLSQVYQLLAPHTVVPESLIQADRRVQTRLGEHRGVTEAGAQCAAPDLADLGSSPGVASWDWSADALWFLSNFCSTGHRQWCPVNVGWAWSVRNNVTFFQAFGMAAAFEQPAHFWGEYQSCTGTDCTWVTAWDEKVPPRYIHTWYFTSLGTYRASLYGSGDTARVHLAILHED